MEAASQLATEFLMQLWGPTALGGVQVKAGPGMVVELGFGSPMESGVAWKYVPGRPNAELLTLISS